MQNFSPRRSWLISLLVFLIAAVSATALIWRSEIAHIEQERTRVAHLTSDYAHAIQLNVGRVLSSTYALAAFVQLGKGELHEFDATAGLLLPFYPGAAALELAPAGVVERVFPFEANKKAIGHNLLKDPERDKEAFRARDTGKLTLAGPFKLIQGGMGAAGRLPVYIDNGKEKGRFWGFVVVLIRFPEILDTAQLPSLVAQGYDYALWRVHPDSGDKHVIAASSDGAMTQAVDVKLEVPNANWTLSVVPAKGWLDLPGLGLKAALGLLGSVLLAAAAHRFSRR